MKSIVKIKEIRSCLDCIDCQVIRMDGAKFVCRKNGNYIEDPWEEILMNCPLPDKEG